MARARSPNRDKAKELWLKSGKNILLKDIATELGVSEEQVRKWKCLDKWEKVTLPKEIKKVNSNVTLPKAKLKEINSGYVGNKNAVGHGAPKGNKNNYKHGIYEKMLFETMSEDERALMQDLELDEETEILKTIRICDVHIVKFRTLVNKEQEKHGGLVVNGVNKTVSNTFAGEIKSSEPTATSETTTTSTISTNELVIRYNQEILKYQKQKIKCLELLTKFTTDKTKLDILLMKMESETAINEQSDNENNFIDVLNQTSSDVWGD